MLGITVPDAIAIGTFFLGLAAFWKGTRAGEAAKKVSASMESSSVSVGAAVFADTMAMQQLTQQLTRIGDILEEASDARRKQEHDRLSQAIEALTRKMDK